MMRFAKMGYPAIRLPPAGLVSAIALRERITGKPREDVHDLGKPARGAGHGLFPGQTLVYRPAYSW